MIIKNIYINHFGCIRDKSVDFDDGMNVISMPNESGKSTMAEFIRVMLYGVNSLRFNQRKKYMPFGNTSMGGEMTVKCGETEYIIKRTFGMRKTDDKVDVFNAVSGARIAEYSVDNVGEVMFGISGDTYENTCYIKQLTAKIDDTKSEEIQSKLINLSQSSDEDYSYRNAVNILDSAIKELNGPRGKINYTQAVINELVLKNAEREKVHDEIERCREQLKNLERNNISSTSQKYLYLSWLPALLSLVSFVAFGFNAISVITFVLFVVFGVFFTKKFRKKTSEVIEHAKQIGFYESRLDTLQKQYDATDVSQIDEYNEKLQKYNKALGDLNYAKVALTSAFEQLQMDYAPRLNGLACGIFKKITDGKYVDFMVDEDYKITVRNEDNMLVPSDYLSSGTYDQIYFSLRMALVDLISDNMPVLLDDAFALYDDERVKKAMGYLKTINNQILVFSCQKREKDFVERI